MPALSEAIAIQVAARLGAGWSVKAGATANRLQLTHADGRAVCLVSEPDDRVLVIGVYPRDARGGSLDPRDFLPSGTQDDYRPAIAHAPGANAARIADAVRRMLPAYTEYRRHMLEGLARRATVRRNEVHCSRE